MSIVSDTKPQFEKAIEHFTQELGSIRTGRATPALLEAVQVEVYGAMQPVKAVASISVPDARTLQIEPWDVGNVQAIESALMKSDIGITPNVDGKIIRLAMPMMTDEMRQKMVKIMKEKVESARIAVRQIREGVKKEIEKTEESDDVKKSMQADLDKLVKEQNERIEEIAKKKEEEITTV
jgi:ribosome recycling factor